MSNLFTLASNEATAGSVFFLNSIFGTVGNVLGGSGPQILGTMFKVFNTSVLALGSLIVTYTTVVSILLTAHEGEALGKKFHTLWIPIRTVMGIAALVPTSSGYSYLQIGLMWFIIQGIGAADTLWTTTFNYVASGGSTAPNSPGATQSLVNLELQFKELFKGLVCQASAKASYGSGYFCSDSPTNAFCTANDTLSVSTGSSQVINGVYQMGPNGICGNLTLGDSSTVGQAKNQAFSQIIPTLGSLASQFVGLDYAYNSFVNSTGTTTPTAPAWLTQYCSDNNLSGSQCTPAVFSSFPSPTPSNEAQSKATVQQLYWTYGLSPVAGGDFIATTANLYAGIVGAALSSSSNTANPITQVQTTAINNGWIYAGGYFYYILQANHSISTNVGTISVSPPRPTELALATEQALTAAATDLLAMIQTTTSSGNNNGLSVSCGTALPGGGANPACDAILSGWVSNLSGSSGASLSQNPVIAAQSEGDTILTAVEVVVPILFFLNIATGMLGGIYLGTSPFAVAATAIVQSLVPIATFILLIFLGIGVTLAVYTPMIPYMLFTFGAINWLIATIETMIAAPLVAIGLLHPEGKHDIWGNAEQALMLVLNIFLRPSLMIFGMISGMLMSYTVVMMINYAFLSVVTMVSQNGANLVEMIFFMVLYTSFFTTSMNKCFDLIHIVPDKVMRWMGGGQEQFGETGGIEKVGQSMEAGGQKTERGIQDAAAPGAGSKAHGKALGKKYGRQLGAGGAGGN